MSEVLDRYTAVAGGFTTRLAGVGPGMWQAVTPCPEWTCRDLVAHVIRTNRSVMARLLAEVPVAVDLDSDLAGQWEEASQAVTEALEDEALALTIVSGMFGERTFESLVGDPVCADTLTHTWDLARATGQDENLDRAAVSHSLEFLVSIDAGMRRPGGFGPRVQPSPDADEQTRMLNFCGREVSPQVSDDLAPT